MGEMGFLGQGYGLWLMGYGLGVMGSRLWVNGGGERG